MRSGANFIVPPLMRNLYADWPPGADDARDRCPIGSHSWRSSLLALMAFMVLRASARCGGGQE
jgi:hypothetical protein